MIPYVDANVDGSSCSSRPVFIISPSDVMVVMGVVVVIADDETAAAGLGGSVSVVKWNRSSLLFNHRFRLIGSTTTASTASVAFMLFH